MWVLQDHERAILVAKIRPALFQEMKDVLVRNLSDILDWIIHVEKLEPHVTEQISDGAAKIDLTR